ncbi:MULTISPECIES: hypothetical protein [Sphingobacterium]|uniref:hypothetical protein n=1 Tax=Sphingobacterium TaxID=28453 RepID=UPI0025802CE2|nr:MULTISPECIES: hypothetical protein [Sphingobacterium]
MKNYLLLSVFLLSAPFVFGQQKDLKAKEEKESKLEMFSAETGSLIEKSNAEIGKIGPISINTSLLTNLISGSKIKGLRIEKPSTKTYGSDAINFLDEDEIDGVLKSIEILKGRIKESPSNYTEINFTSRSKFEFGAYFSKEWKYYIQVKKYDSDSIYFMGENNLNQFEQLVTQAKAALKAL